MKKLFIVCCFLLVCCGPAAVAQINWKDTSQPFTDIAWNNYSTTYLGEGSDRIPLIVTAIPYNGVYDHVDVDAPNTPMDMSFSGSAFRFRSQLSNKTQQLYTYDSGMVYFLTPGIFRESAAHYEFRILQDDTLIIKPWGPVTQFTDSSFQLNAFRRNMGFLGGYRTTWGHYLVAELRLGFDTSEVFARSVVFWRPTKPVLQAIFTTRELTQQLLSVSNDYRVDEAATNPERWKEYAPADLDSLTGLPRHWIVAPNPDALAFQVSTRVYRKGALEYRLIRHGKLVTDWTGNKANNSYIWIDSPGPGDYVLEMRYRQQRHNVTAYPFTVEPAWYQTWAFWIILGVLKLAFVGFLVVLVKLWRQRKKTAAEQAKKERFEQGLKSVYAQLNPHFTFNALSSIQGLINNNDIRGANRYLADFASLVRHSLADSEQPSIPLQRELQTLETYLTLEKLRFNFSYEIQCADEVPVAETAIPSLLLQPLAENAVKHGVSTLQEQGQIRIGITRQGADMLVRISDNGPGFDAVQKQPGYGLKLTRDRIRLLNDMSATTPIILNIISTPGKGATIELLFKNWLA
jgi:two-component system LytT family sensor kinase